MSEELKKGIPKAIPTGHRELTKEEKERASKFFETVLKQEKKSNDKHP